MFINFGMVKYKVATIFHAVPWRSGVKHHAFLTVALGGGDWSVKCLRERGSRIQQMDGRVGSRAVWLL